MKVLEDVKVDTANPVISLKLKINIASIYLLNDRYIESRVIPARKSNIPKKFEANQ